MTTVRWTGAAGLEFIDRDFTLLLDPFLSRHSRETLQAGPAISFVDQIEAYISELPRRSVDAIIMGHTHFDHALDIVEFTRFLDGPLIGSRSLETLMAIHGMPGRVTVCRGGEQVNISARIRVTMLESRHGIIRGSVPFPGEIDPGKKPPLQSSDFRHGTVFMPKLEIGNTTFMMVGSANYHPASLQDHQCDVLFICVPGWQAAAGYTTELLKRLNPDILIPYHFDNFFLPLPDDRRAPHLTGIDMPGFCRAVGKTLPHAEIVQVETFEPITF